jgi:hypothetical protein
MSHPFGPTDGDASAPLLDPVIVSDEETLASAVDSFIGRDAGARRWHAWIVEEQERLRQAAPPDVWQMIMRLDEICVARWADLTLALARWAFEQGQQHPTSEGSS